MAEIFGMFRKRKEEAKEGFGEPARKESKQETVASKQGKLIVIEGNDGSGKRTQLELLAAKLRQSHAVEILDFPDYSSFYGKIIRRYLDGGFGKNVNPYLIALAYANDRLLKRDIMRKWLDRGRVVLCNRYVASNKAYQTVKFQTPQEMQEFVKWVDEMEYEVNNLPRPDLTVYLYVPSEIALGLVEQRAEKAKSKADLHETLSNMKKVEQVYLAMTKNKNWLRIDCVKDNEMLTKDEAHKKIHDAVSSLI